MKRTDRQFQLVKPRARMRNDNKGIKTLSQFVLLKFRVFPRGPKSFWTRIYLKKKDLLAKID